MKHYKRRWSGRGKGDARYAGMNQYQRAYAKAMAKRKHDKEQMRGRA